MAPVSAATITSSVRASSRSNNLWLAPVSNKKRVLRNSFPSENSSRGVTSASRSSIMPRLNRDRRDRSCIASSARASAASLRIDCARLRKSSPAGVNASGRALRFNSVAPRAASRLVNCWLTAEGLAPSRRAVAEIDSSSAVAANTSIPQSVTLPGVSTIPLLASRFRAALLRHLCKL